MHWHMEDIFIACTAGLISKAFGEMEQNMSFFYTRRKCISKLEKARARYQSAIKNITRFLLLASITVFIN